MKKAFLVVCLMMVAFQFAPAQKSAAFISEHRLFHEAEAMFNDLNYAGCINKLNEYQATATDPDFLQEAEYMLAVCAYKQGRGDAELLLKNYLDSRPDSRHKDQAYLYIGSSHFSKEEYRKAIYWFEQAELDYLPLSEQEDYAYRMAYSCMKSDKNEEARRLFGLLRANSERYSNAATYYTGYLDYKDQQYLSALTIFESLRNHPEFRKSAGYYITQIQYIRGENAQAIQEGERLLANYPYDPANTEIHRIVGNAYYKGGNREKAIQHLLEYANKGGKFIREDLYILGLCYFETGDDVNAIKFLSQSIVENDAIEQNAYLLLGQAYLKTGDKKSAIMAFEAASRTNYDLKTKEAATYNYAMLLHENSVSAFGESVTILENFLNEFPHSMYADKVNDCLVDVYLTTKNYEAALASINKISKPGTKILEAKQKIYFHLGTVAYVNNQFSQAVSYFTQAMQAGDYAPKEKANARYWRGDAYFRMENDPAAIADFKAFLQAGSGGDARLLILANYNLGYCFFNQQQYSAAKPWFDNYLDMEKDKTQATLADAYNRQGDCFFYARQFKNAETAYEQAAKLQPGSADYSLFQSGFVLGLQKDYKGKIVAMDQLIAKYPDSRYLPDALYEKGGAYVMLENPNEAIATYQDLVSRYPKNAYARKAGTQIGLLYFNQNKLPQAVAAYKKVISEYPGSDEARVAMQDLKTVYMEMNDINAYAQYVSSLGNVRFEMSEQDSLTYLVAEKMFIKGDEKQAQGAFRNYLQSFSQGAFAPKAHYYLAGIYYNQKEYANAKKELAAVLSSGDTEFTEDALLKLGDIEFREKDYKSALNTYERLSSMAAGKGNKVTALLGIMRCAFPTDKYADVINATNALLKESNLSPEQTSEARYYRAKGYLGVKEGNKAVADLKELGKDTRTAFGAEAKYLLAQYYFDTKQMERAESEIQEFIKSGTPHSYWLARGFILLSDVYASKGDTFQARQYLESLQHNYKGEEEDIITMIRERMEMLKN